MKVCDLHTGRQAVDAITIQADGTVIDVCAECKAEVLAVFAIEPKDTNGAKPRRKRGLLTAIKEELSS